MARRGLLPLLALVAFALGFALRGGGGDQREPAVASPADARPGSVWTCSMHPQIQLPESGKCPICFMDLIPVESGAGTDESERRLTMSDAARRLAEIRTARVGMRDAETEIRMAGKVEYDETRLTHVTSRVRGRLDRLYVDYTGIRVRDGDHMADIYSPELVGAQQELLEAARAVERLSQSDIPSMRTTAQATLDAARDKLRLWGLTGEQVGVIETRGTSQEQVTIYAPTSGIVIEKHVSEGSYVDEGARLYTIADLMRVWVMLDAYESDVSWIRYGQEVQFEAQAHPGKTFDGVISFIGPTLDEATRTVKVRVNVENTALLLKPGMFVRARVLARVRASGAAMDARVSGRWICPMHPEIVSEARGACSECGMDLVSAESLGYHDRENEANDLAIPASSVLITGKRAVVYVEVPDAEQPTYEGREVVLGPRAGDFYIVRSGLSDGERVVTHGAFKIDSALQIQARPSMMSPDDEGSDH